MTIGPIDNGASRSTLLALDERLNQDLAGDSGAEIAALLLLGARDARDRASDLAQAEERHLRELEDRQVESLYAQAEATRSAGWARGIGLMASGAAGLLGSQATASGGNGAAEAPVGRLVQGGATFLASAYEFEASRHGARATEAANRQGHVERHLQELAQVRSEAAQLARDALQAASELARTEAASEQATLYLRG